MARDSLTPIPVDRNTGETTTPERPGTICLLNWKETDMLRTLCALPVLLASAAMAFSELPDSTGRQLGLDSLARKVDSLEASLTQLRFELEGRSPYVNGAALKWGSGLGVGSRWHQYGGDIELRYTFRKGMEPKAVTRLFKYLSWSILTGARRVSDLTISPVNEFTPGGSTVAGFVGVRMTTPIFLNYTSLEFGPDLFWPDVRRTWQPNGSGSLEVQVWLTKKMHYNIGTSSNVEIRDGELSRMYDLFRPYMGFTIFLFQPRDKSGLTSK